MMLGSFGAVWTCKLLCCNPLGTDLGGLAYGFALMIMKSYPPSWANVLPCALLVATLLISPGGILRRRVRHV